MTCPDRTATVEARIDEVLTQYRESPNLLFLLRTYLGAVTDLHLQVCDLPERFDLNTATGDQLTLVGKRLGWPRCHCVCVAQPVFGFECMGFPSSQPLAGFCEAGSTWRGCGEFGVGDVCIIDDEIYRGFLRSRARQAATLFDRANLQAAITDLFGPTGRLMDAGLGQIVVSPGRDLTPDEIALLPLYPRVLPLAPGVEARFHFDDQLVFGFGLGWGGFCEPAFSQPATLATEDGDEFVTEDGDFITTGLIQTGAPWLCRIDVRPYDC